MSAEMWEPECLVSAFWEQNVSAKEGLLFEKGVGNRSRTHNQYFIYNKNAFDGYLMASMIDSSYAYKDSG